MNMEVQSSAHGDSITLPPLPDSRPAPGLFTQSLRLKGYLFNGLLLCYILFMVIFALSQRHQPLQQLEQYQRIQQAQQALKQADLAAFHIVTVMFSDVRQQDLMRVGGYFSSLREQYISLQRWFPEQAAVFRELVDSIPARLEQPSDETLRRIQFHLARSKSQLDRLAAANQDRLTALVEDYRIRNEETVATIVVLGIIGLVLLGGLISLFINQLKRDIQFLQQRTAEIVEGYRGKPLPVHRHDEVGQLTQGVNFMADALAEREQALEIQRNKAAFEQKMVAIDSLAGGIAHEVGNPIAAIMGLAEVIRNDDTSKLSESSRQSLQSIADYSQGLVRLTRELSVFDTHKGSEYEWLDINQLISSTVNLCHYDKRWAGIDIRLQLDHGVPAVYASKTQLSQLVSNVLENAREALQHIDSPAVTVVSALQPNDRLLLQFIDNGSGIDADVQEHIFDPFFSTKPVGQGTGLGLSICWTIARNHNGSIRVKSNPGQGATLSVELPTGETIPQLGNNERCDG